MNETNNVIYEHKNIVDLVWKVLKGSKFYQTGLKKGQKCCITKKNSREDKQIRKIYDKNPGKNTIIIQENMQAKKVTASITKLIRS
jgi:hypothetical protein